MKLLPILLALCGVAHAQSALPTQTPDLPGSAYTLTSPNGSCIWWYVYKDRITPENQLGIEFVAYCAVPSEFSKIGGRVATIVKSADPLKSLQTLRSRVSGITNIRCPGMGRCTADDPALAPIVAEMNAARGM